MAEVTSVDSSQHTHKRGRFMRRRVQILTILVAFTLIAAACGNGDDGTASPGTDVADVTSVPEDTPNETASDEPTPTVAPSETAPPEEAPADTTAAEPVAGDSPCGLSSGQEASGEPIPVGAIVGATGPADFSSASRSAAAYFACVNANGGINGRPIDYIVEDDAWDPEIAATAARGLVEDDDVVAMIASTSFVECGVNAQYYEDNNVAVIAGVGVPRECFFSRNIAPTNQGPRLSGIGAAQYALQRDPEMTTLACLANSIPNFGAWVCEGITEWGANNGVTVETFLIAPDGSDIETVVIQAIQADPDAAVTIDPAPLMIAYLQVAEQQEDTRPWYGATSAYDLAFPDAVGPYWVDRYWAQIELAPLDSAGTDNQSWVKLMDEFGNDDDPRDSFSQAGFVAAKIFVDTMLGLDPDSIDRATTTEALIGVSDFETDILCDAWYFGEAELHNANNAGRVVQLVADGIGWETVTDCFNVEDPALAPIYEAEGN